VCSPDIRNAQKQLEATLGEMFAEVGAGKDD
jgi:hypothetical protein